MMMKENGMKNKLIALFDYGWLTDDEIDDLEFVDIDVKIYLVNEEPEMRISLDDLNNIQKAELYKMLNDNVVEELENNKYTWLVLYK